MRKLIMVIVCLIAAINSFAQYRHYIPRHYYQRSYVTRHYYSSDSNLSYSTNEGSDNGAEFKKLNAGFGLGIDWTNNEENNKKASSLIIEGIFCNILAEMHLYGLKENTDFTENHISFSWKIGYIVRAIKYNKGFIGIGPLIGKTYIQAEKGKAYSDHYWSTYYHYNTCQEPKYKNWEFGGVAAIRYGYGYLSLKITNKTIGTSIGIAY